MNKQLCKQWSFTVVITQITATIMIVISDNDKGQKEDKLQTHASTKTKKDSYEDKSEQYMWQGVPLSVQWVIKLMDVP